MSRRLAFALLFVSCANSFGQSEEQAASFKVDVNLVVVHATVEDSKGRIVKGLGKEDFRILEDGTEREIRLFSSDDAPVTVGLVVDSSGSMKNKKSQVLAGALAFASASHSQDEIFIVQFSDNVRFGLPAGQLFTSKVEDLKEALGHSVPRGKTALYDALVAASERLEHGKRGKKVLLVISDGGDNASEADLKQVLELADRSGAIAYAIGIFDELSDETNPGALKRLAKMTGGRSFFPKNIAAVGAICVEIAQDIRSQYMLAYAPERSLEAKYHKIQILASSPDHRKLRVRARQGYYTDAPPK